MNFLSKLVTAVKRVDRKIWPNHRINLSPPLISQLANSKLIIADVGSADGCEERWLTLEGLTKFITFEPNPRELQKQEDIVNFPIGLWSSKKRMKLHITSHPDSSSLCEINQKVFCDYLIQEGSQVVGHAEIDLDTLDSCLEDKNDLKPHFLKVDVEGGDLEVMIGGDLIINTTVLGLRTEATLLPLWKDAPQLWDVNRYLNSKGFVLFSLGKVSWIRNNGTFGYTSQPQFIWGDAVYFLTKPEFLNRLKNTPVEERNAKVVHFIVILLAHGCHDYAMEIIEAANASDLISKTLTEECRLSIKRSTDSSTTIILWLAIGAFFAAVVYLLLFLVTPMRQHAKFYFKQRLGRFGHSLLRWAGKAGRPYGAAIEEQYD